MTLCGFKNGAAQKLQPRFFRLYLKLFYALISFSALPKYSFFLSSVVNGMSSKKSIITFPFSNGVSEPITMRSIPITFLVSRNAYLLVFPLVEVMML